MRMCSKITGKGSRWIRLVEEFGHLGSEDVDRLLVGVSELSPEAAEASPSHPAPVDERLLRRAAAIMLFGQTMDSSTLEEDWALLFS